VSERDYILDEARNLPPDVIETLARHPMAGANTRMIEGKECISLGRFERCPGSGTKVASTPLGSVTCHVCWTSGIGRTKAGAMEEHTRKARS